MNIKSYGLIASLSASFRDVLEEFSNNGGGVIWILGGDSKFYLELVNAQTSNLKIGDLGSRLDAAADLIEKELLNIDSQVLFRDEDRLAWSASLIGDRSPYSGDLQVNVARYLVMQDILQEGGQHLFFVEDNVVAGAFDKTARSNGLYVKCFAAKKLPSATFGALYARASALKLYWQNSRRLKRARKKTPPPWDKLQSCDVLIIDWVGEQSFNSKGQTSTVGNMARMPEVLRNAGLKVGFIANPLSWTQDYSKISKNICEAFDPVVGIDECRSLMSVILGAFSSWRMSQHLKKYIQMCGFDISPLFEFERIKDLHRTQSTLAYTVSYVGKLLKTNGVKPKVIVYPCEFQYWEAALLDGIRKHLPETRIVGYQHAPFPARYLGFYPSSREIKSKYLPDNFILMGERYKNLYIKKGYPTELLSVGGSLRFESALGKIKNLTPDLKQKSTKVILIGTSIEFFESLDLVMKAGQVIKNLPSVSIIVNFHPVVDDAFRAEIHKALLLVLGDEIDRVELSRDKIDDIIIRADVLLYNNSGVVFDAMFVNVPSVFVAVDGNLSFDRIPANISRRATNSDELGIILTDIFSSNGIRNFDTSVGGCIGPVNEKIIVSSIIGS